jgi:cysteine-S-conjugate beta-lyase
MNTGTATPAAGTNPLRLPLADLRRRTSAKWRWYPSDVLPLWVAEMDVALAGPIAEALHHAITTGDTGYPAGTGYAEALAGFAARRWDWSIEVAACGSVADVMTGSVEVLKLVTGAGDAVVVNPPVYPPFYRFIEHLGRRVAPAPLTAGHRIDLGALEATFAQATAGRRPAAYLLCNPHNPTGTVHTREELSAVAELAARYRVRVVADEIHAPLVLPPARFVPYLTVEGGADAFAVFSASKAWNLAGLKAALVVAGADARADLARMPEVISHGASHLGVVAHTAALRHGGPWLDALLPALAVNRGLLADLLARHLPEIRCRPAEGTFLAWLDCRALGLGDDPAAAFLDHGRVALSAGPTFGTGGAGHARLNFATSAEILTEAVHRMAAAAGRAG